MNRDFGLALEVLVAIEQGVNMYTVNSTPELIKYHFDMLEHIGCIAVENRNHTSVRLYNTASIKLTWAGHDMIDTLRFKLNNP